MICSMVWQDTIWFGKYFDDFSSHHQTFSCYQIHLQMDYWIRDVCPQEQVTVTPGLWLLSPDTMTVIRSHTRVTLMRCQMFHVPMSVLWLVTLLMLDVYTALYSILHSSQYSGVRTTIQDPPWTAAEAAWARVSLTPRPGIICLGLALTTLPKLFRGYSVNTLPRSHIISKDLRNFSSFVS